MYPRKPLCSSFRCLLPTGGMAFMLLLASAPLFAQTLVSSSTAPAPAKPFVVFVPERDDSASLADTLAVITARYRSELDTLRGDNRKYIARLFTERYEGIKSQFQEKSLLTLPEAQAYLRAVTQNIIRSNPSLQGLPINFYFSKTGIPNAASCGEGLIVFNIGLFAKLDNESQLVFVLCHELAHLYMRHSNNGIYKYVNTLYSRETQKDLAHIKREQYNKGTQLESLVRSFAFDNRRHSRDHESEADSVGLVFMHNTAFDLRESLTCLSLLDTVDQDNFNTEAFLKNAFNTPDYPFQPRWLREETGLLGGHAVLKSDRKLEDSLKTHPDCKARVIALEAAVGRYQHPGMQKDLVDRAEFDRLKQVFPYEIIRYYFDSKQYSACLMAAFELLQRSPGDPYVIVSIGNTFNNMYAAQRNHVLSKCIELPAPGQNPEYNTLLQFLQNLYLDDVAMISYHFLKQYQGSLAGYGEYAVAFATSRQVSGINDKH